MITTEAVLNACRAAYKKGMIEAAQDICWACTRQRPEIKENGKVVHDGGLTACEAGPIIRRIEWAGGWQAEWPAPVPMRTDL